MSDHKGCGCGLDPLRAVDEERSTYVTEERGTDWGGIIAAVFFYLAVTAALCAAAISIMDHARHPTAAGWLAVGAMVCIGEVVITGIVSLISDW